jgi:arylsulfatase A-like enzyme
MHWPDSVEWLDRLTPADTELARTGATFRAACAASCMCSPSRASLLTGRWPAEHGVELTLTQGGARVRRRYGPAALRRALKAVRRGEIGFFEATKTIIRTALRRPDGGRDERELDPDTPNLSEVLGRVGYRTVIKGKWHLTHPASGAEWTEADSRRLAGEYGFHDWEPPDAGENIEPTHFGGGTLAGRSRQGFDEDFCRQVEAFLEDPPDEPWALIVSMVNPHDVLAFPSSFEEGGYLEQDWADLDEVELPDSADENLADKPRAHVIQSFGQTGFLGPLADRDSQLAYCRFYAHLHRLVDERVGRIVEALGDPSDPHSLRSSTVVVRTSDHGEMGMSHGGLRQKMFNAYDETINVPLIVSNPVLFSEPAVIEEAVSLCDVLPTLATLAGANTSDLGLRGQDLTPLLAGAVEPEPEMLAAAVIDFGALLEGSGEVEGRSRYAHFTFDDHQSGTAYTNVVPGPNRIRAVRSKDAMYAVYFDPGDPTRFEYELYDMTRDPGQQRNLVHRDTGEVLDPADSSLRDRLHAALRESMREARTEIPIEPPGPG